MSVISLVFVSMLAWFIYSFVRYNSYNQDKALRMIAYGRSIGLFAFVTGILGQLVGLYAAFTAIEQAGNIDPALVYGGLKVSMIPTLYGFLIYLVSLILWFLASWLIEKRS